MPKAPITTQPSEISPRAAAPQVGNADLTLSPPILQQPHLDLQEAVTAVLNGFETQARGQLIMPSGTSRTLTALKIAEQLLGNKPSLVIYLVPSQVLLNQTVFEWKRNACNLFLAYAVCSDPKSGQKSGDGDLVHCLADLQCHASSDVYQFAGQVFDDLNELFKAKQKKMVVFFATYPSLQLLHNIFGKLSWLRRDLIICDEAHCMVGSRGGIKKRLFTRINDDEYLFGRKRLFMSDKPMVDGEAAKRQKKSGAAVVHALNDESKFGPVFYSSQAAC